MLRPGLLQVGKQLRGRGVGETDPPRQVHVHHRIRVQLGERSQVDLGLLGLPAPRVGPVQRNGRHPHQADETCRQQDGMHRGGPVLAIESRPLPRHQQQVQQHRDQEDGKQQASGHHAAGILTRQQRHQRRCGPSQGKAEESDHSRQGCQERHAGGRRTRGVKARNVVKIAHQRHGGDNHAQSDQVLGRPMSATRAHVQQQHRQADQEKIHGRIRRHAARINRPHRAGGLREEQLVDAEIPARGVLQEREEPDGGDDRRARPGDVAARPKTAAAGPGKPQPDPDEHEGCRRVRLHGNQVGIEALQDRDVEDPTEQHQAAEGEDAHGRRHGNGLEPANQARLALPGHRLSPLSGPRRIRRRNSQSSKEIGALSTRP